MLITDKNDIAKELKDIQNQIEVEMQDDPVEAQYRGNYLVAQIARTGKLLADAKLHRDKKLNSSIIEQMKKISQLPASTANKFAEALCEEENYLVNWCERLNRACTHQLDWCRTVLSKAKEEMRQFPTR